MTQRGKYFQSNRITRIYLDALAEVMGQHGLIALLRLAGLLHWIDNLPPCDDALKVDFADFATLNATLESMYGPRGGRALAMRAGRVSLEATIAQLGASIGLAETTFKLLPEPERVRALLEGIAKGTALQSDATATVIEEKGRLLYQVNLCPACWGRTGVNHPVCHGTAGFLQQAIEWAGSSEGYWVDEIECAATATQEGVHTCVFAITPRA